MNHKKTTRVLFATSLAVGILFFFGWRPISSFICENENYYSFFGATYSDSSTCDDGVEGVFTAILSLSFALLLVSSALFFVRRETFLTWAKFASVAFPLLIVIILYFIFDADWRHHGLGVGISDSEAIGIISIGLATLFLLLSLAIIGWKSYKLRGK